MILTLGIVAAVGLGLVTGGKLDRLTRVEIRWWPVVLAAVALQFISVGTWTTEAVAGVPIRQAAFVVTHTLILAVAAANLGLDGFRAVVLGAAVNLVALLANGGLMPVSAEARVAAGHQAALDSLATGAMVLGSKGVVLPADQSNLWLLTDILVAPRPLPVTAIFSIGDLLVVLGLGFLIIKTMQREPGTA